MWWQERDLLSNYVKHFQKMNNTSTTVLFLVEELVLVRAMNMERCGVLAISNMVKHLGGRDAEGNLGTLRALLHMPTNLSQAFIWWKAWMHTEYTPCTELCKLVDFFLWHFLQQLKGFFDFSLWLPKNFFESQLDKYLIWVPLCFYSAQVQTIQKSP